MNIVNDLVGQYGYEGDRLTLRMANVSRNGLSYQSFLKIQSESPVAEESWAQLLHLSERTLQRYKKDQKAFEPIQSERILKLALLFKFGENVFGSMELFRDWLHDASIPLGGSSPVSLLDTTFGIDLVHDELGRIQHGIFS